MKLFNQIQRGPLQERLTRGLGIQERSPAPTLASDIQAVVLLEDLTRQNPWHQPTERVWACQFTQPAVVAEFGTVTLESPPGGKAIFVVDEVTVVSPTAVQVVWGWTPFQESTIELAHYVDVRNAPDPLNNRGGPVIRRGTEVATLIDGDLGIMRVSTTLTMQRLRNLGIVLSPRLSTLSNDALMFFCATVNTDFTISLRGREYFGP